MVYTNILRRRLVSGNLRINSKPRASQKAKNQVQVKSLDKESVEDIQQAQQV